MNKTETIKLLPYKPWSVAMIKGLDWFQYESQLHRWGSFTPGGKKKRYLMKSAWRKWIKSNCCSLAARGLRLSTEARSQETQTKQQTAFLHTTCAKQWYSFPPCLAFAVANVKKFYGIEKRHGRFMEEKSIRDHLQPTKSPGHKSLQTEKIHGRSVPMHIFYSYVLL